MWKPKRPVRVLFWLVAALLITVSAWFGQRQYVAYQEYRYQQMVQEEIERIHKQLEELRNGPMIQTLRHHGDGQELVLITLPDDRR